MTCANQAELDGLWEGLSAGGGEPGRCGWLRDRFGVSWQIVPAMLGDMLRDADPARAGRVMQALLRMGRLDIETLSGRPMRVRPALPCDLGGDPLPARDGAGRDPEDAARPVRPDMNGSPRLDQPIGSFGCEMLRHPMQAAQSFGCDGHGVVAARCLAPSRPGIGEQMAHQHRRG